MPTRRTLELVLISVVLMQPVLALARVWAAKTLATSQQGTVAHGTAEVVHVLS